MEPAITTVKTVERMCGVAGVVSITLPAEPWAKNARRWVPPIPPSQRPRPEYQCTRDRVWAHLQDGQAYTANEIAAAIGARDTRVRDALQHFRRTGKAACEGFRPGGTPGKWRICK